MDRFPRRQCDGADAQDKGRCNEHGLGEHRISLFDKASITWVLHFGDGTITSTRVAAPKF
jgi:hypothetical protein